MHNFKIGSRVRQIGCLSGGFTKEDSKTGTIIGSHYYKHGCLVKFDNSITDATFLFNLVPESLENWEAELNKRQQFTFDSSKQ